MSVAEALRAAADRLSAVSDTARLDAEVLMAHALGCTRSDLLLRHTRDAAPDSFAPLVERRMACEPVAHITGQQEFFGLPFMVTPDTLIPRGDSEVLVEQALAARPDAPLPASCRVLDCGTGTGALLLAVLHHLPKATGVGIDRSEAALSVARENAEALGLASRARMALADWDQPGWEAPLGGPFDLILANPPYVETGAQLAASVREFEPDGALFAGRDGLDAYRVLVPQLPRLLAPQGLALVEIGACQAEAVAGIAQACGLETTLHRDLANRPRCLAMHSFR